jgi:hypothetical protein
MQRGNGKRGSYKAKEQQIKRSLVDSSKELGFYPKCHKKPVEDFKLRSDIG